MVVPALRERRDEIQHLVDFFTAKYAKKYERPARSVSEELRRMFMEYEWPGNIRELENMIKRIVILQDEQLVVREIQRNMQRSAAIAAGVQVYALAPTGGGAASASSLPVGMMM